MEILYRPAKKKESLRLAELINIASEGGIDYLFHDLIPGMTPVEIVAHGLEGDEEHHTYRNALVAQQGLKAVGIALSYPSHLHRITDEMRRLIPKERLEPLQSFYSVQVENSLYLDALCVEEAFRGRGIGSELITLVKAKAEEIGYQALSLMVFADNTRAQRLYWRHGFEVVQRVELTPHPLIPHEGGCLLMRCAVRL